MNISPSFRTVGYYQGHQVDLNEPICISLPRSLIWPLCVHLSSEQALMTDFGGGDWRKLADFIGLPAIMIDTIEEYRGDKTKAYTLFKLWDRGIRRNHGTLLKLIIALHKAGFAESYLREFIINPLKDCIDFQAITDYIRALGPDEIRQLFPILNLTDIEWDEQLESDVIQTSLPSSTTEGEEDCKSHERSHYPPRVHPHVIKDSVFISYFSDSRDDKYKREVENIARTFKHRKHPVWYGPSLDSSQRELCIRSAQTILVAFNQEYHQAWENSLRGHLVPSSCVARDIPLLDQLFHSGAKRQIIPIVVEVKKTRHVGDMPVWLTGVPRFLYPSQKKALVHTVQGVNEYAPSKPVEVRRVQPKVIDKDEARRRFQSRT